MKTRFVIAVTAIALSGCASIFSGTTQEVGIRTTPGANFTVTNSYGSQVASGESPAAVNLTRGASYFSPHSYKVKMSKPGYKSKTVDVVPGMNPWYFGNILLGGFVGMVIVDPLTGAMFKLYPRDIDIQLEPTGEDGGAVRQDETNLQKTRLSPTSRNDYTARQKAHELNCVPMGDPTVDGLNTAKEIITFACRDGRQLTLQCQSGEGCRS